MICSGVCRRLFDIDGSFLPHHHGVTTQTA